jgi:hypothetical protein
LSAKTILFFGANEDLFEFLASKIRGEMPDILTHICLTPEHIIHTAEHWVSLGLSIDIIVVDSKYLLTTDDVDASYMVEDWVDNCQPMSRPLPKLLEFFKENYYFHGLVVACSIDKNQNDVLSMAGATIRADQDLPENWRLSYGSSMAVVWRNQEVFDSFASTIINTAMEYEDNTPDKDKDPLGRAATEEDARIIYSLLPILAKKKLPDETYLDYFRRTMPVEI